MVVATNPNPSSKEFHALLDGTLKSLTEKSQSEEKTFLTHLGNKLEQVVVDVMRENANV